jgi:hypothetical protein
MEEEEEMRKLVAVLWTDGDKICERFGRPDRQFACWTRSEVNGGSEWMAAFRAST